jgi:virginiamycin A acetyltransferase
MDSDATTPRDLREGRRFPVLGPLLVRAYRPRSRQWRQLIRRCLLWLEGGQLHSLSLRDIQRAHYRNEVGLYTTGGLGGRTIRPGASVGRFCQIDPTARAFNANHPSDTISGHAFFYNPALGYASKDLLSRTRLHVGHDVRIEAHAVVTASVSMIGTGAVIGANSVVFQDVPPYAIVKGNPGRITGYRFAPETIERLLESKWWDQPLSELLKDLPSFQRPVGDTSPPPAAVS